MPRTRLYDEDVLVVGLGRFGSAAALELHRLGHRVLAVEKDPVVADRFAGQVGKVVTGNGADPALLDSVKARGFRLAVVGVGAVEASVLTAGMLVDAGIASIWAKAVSHEHARILERIGVHHVVRPEHDTGQRIAHLLNGKLMDYISFADGYAIVRMSPPRELVGFTLAQSKVRSKYGVTVVGVKAPNEDFTHAVPETKVGAQHTLIVSGPSDLLERLASRP